MPPKTALPPGTRRLLRVVPSRQRRERRLLAISMSERAEVPSARSDEQEPEPEPEPASCTA